MASQASQKLLVVGGNGYLGSAICRAGVSRGWDVTSISSSGKTWRTPGGHSRKWTDSVSWQAADAFQPSTYASLVAGSTAVVHTLGMLIEDEGYKKHVREGNVLGLIGSLMGGGSRGNPLMRGLSSKDKGKQPMTYERMNRDSALTVLQTILSTPYSSPSPPPLTTSNPYPSLYPTNSRPFVYISAEDIFRPIIPEGYINTKRQAEAEILRMCAEAHALLSQQSATDEHNTESSQAPDGPVRPIFIRPGLMYHPHNRPLTTPLAVLLDITSSLHQKIGLPLPLPASSSGALGALFAAANSLKVPPIHVDQVAECVVKSIENDSVTGVVDTRQMRRWIGLDKSDKPSATTAPITPSQYTSPFNTTGGVRPFSTSVSSTPRRSLYTSSRRLASASTSQTPTTSSTSQFSVTPPSIDALFADEDFGPETEIIPASEAAINITDAALAQLVKIATKEPDNKELALRLAVDSGGCHGYQYRMELTEQPREVDDYVFQGPGEHCLPILVDLTSLGLLKGE